MSFWFTNPGFHGAIHLLPPSNIPPIFENNTELEQGYEEVPQPVLHLLHSNVLQSQIPQQAISAHLHAARAGAHEQSSNAASSTNPSGATASANSPTLPRLPSPHTAMASSESFYQCPICQLVARHPIQVPCCKHWYCCFCFLQYTELSVSRGQNTGTIKCAYCRGEFYIEQTFRAAVSEERITLYNSLMVLCPYNCGYRGHPAFVCDHQWFHCSKRKIKCPNIGCERIDKAENILAHFDQCIDAHINCPSCGLPVRLTNFMTHNCIEELRSVVSTMGQAIVRIGAPLSHKWVIGHRGASVFKTNLNKDKPPAMFRLLNMVDAHRSPATKIQLTNSNVFQFSPSPASLVPNREINLDLLHQQWAQIVQGVQRASSSQTASAATNQPEQTNRPTLTATRSHRPSSRTSPSNLANRPLPPIPHSDSPETIADDEDTWPDGWLSTGSRTNPTQH